MFKQILIAAAVTFSAATANAQINFGAKGGLNISKIGGADGDEYKAKTGLYLGGLVQIPVTAKFSVQPELLFSSEGGKWDSKDGGKTILNYLNVPVLAKYSITEKVFAETGPQIGFLFSAKDKWSDGDEQDIKKYLKSNTFSWAIGAGYQVNQNIGVNLRYTLAITEFYPEEKMNNFQVGVFYLLGKRK